MTLFYCTTDQVHVLSISSFASIFVGVMPLFELWKLEYTVFHTFLLHALKYWAEILHMTLSYCTADEECRQFASIFVGVMPLLNLEYWIYTVFHTFLFTALTYWAEILHMILFYCTTDQECRQFASIFVGVMPLLELRILEIHSFQHFSLTCFGILSLDFSHDFFKYTIYQYRVSSLCTHLVLRASTHFLHFPPRCMDKFSRN